MGFKFKKGDSFAHGVHPPERKTFSEPMIINPTAVTSSKIPNVRKISTEGVMNLNRCTEILPMPYDKSANVIIKAPIIASGSISLLQDKSKYNFIFINI